MPDYVKPTVLMADDDEDDRLVARDAFEQALANGSFLCVEDGHELLEYLFGTRESVADGPKNLPDLILLDLNMPGKDGREALKEIKSFPEFRKIPIVVLTTSREEKDIVFSREMGANSFLTKPSKYDHWVQMMALLAEKWLQWK